MRSDEWMTTWLFLGGPLDGQRRAVERGVPYFQCAEPIGNTRIADVDWKQRFDPEDPAFAFKTIEYTPEPWKDGEGNTIHFARVAGDRKPVLAYLVEGYMASAEDKKQRSALVRS